MCIFILIYSKAITKIFLLSFDYIIVIVRSNFEKKTEKTKL